MVLALKNGTPPNLAHGVLELDVILLLDRDLKPAQLPGLPKPLDTLVESGIRFAPTILPRAIGSLDVGEKDLPRMPQRREILGRISPRDVLPIQNTGDMPPGFVEEDVLIPEISMADGRGEDRAPVRREICPTMH